jgi:ABC-type enterochelin transport system permease subunit
METARVVALICPRVFFLLLSFNLKYPIMNAYAYSFYFPAGLVLLLFAGIVIASFFADRAFDKIFNTSIK